MSLQVHVCPLAEPMCPCGWWVWVSLPAEPSATTLCHLQPGQESGSPHRGTHGWAPCANTVLTHPITCRHVHMPVLTHLNAKSIMCAFHNLFLASSYFLSEKLSRTLVISLSLSLPHNSLTICCSDSELFDSPPTPPFLPRLLSWKRKKIAQTVKNVIMPPFQAKSHTNKF